MLSFFISVLLSSISPVQAATVGSCKGVNGVVREVIFLEHQDCELAVSLSDIFNGMAQTFQSTASVNLVIGGPSDNASFDNGAIVHEALRKSAGDEYKSLFTKLDDLSARKLAILKGASDVSFVGDSTALYYSPEFAHISSRMGAYSEFFADVLAVYHFNDRRAMVKALYHDGLDDFQYNYIRMLAEDLENEEEPEWELANQNLIRELESVLPTVGTEAFSR